MSLLFDFPADAVFFCFACLNAASGKNPITPPAFVFTVPYQKYLIISNYRTLIPNVSLFHSAPAISYLRVVSSLISPPLSFPQFQGDGLSQNFVGAFVYLGNFGVPHHFLDRVVAHITGATQNLHRINGHFHSYIRGEDLGHRRGFGVVDRKSVV